MDKIDMKRLTLSVPADVVPMLESLAGGERQKGVWITKVVRAAYEGSDTPDANSNETLQLQIVGLLAKLNGLETEVGELRAKVANI